MQIKAGARLKSAVCETQVIVVKAPAGDVDITCGGAPLVAMDETVAEGGAPASGWDGGTLLGKRYADDEVGIELLCTKAGKGALGLNGAPLELKQAKALPSSD